MISTTLYKTRIDGSIQKTIRKTESYVSIIETGTIDGVMTKFKEVIHEGKNIGRANETTPQEQAVKEHESWVTKKKEAGYVLHLSDLSAVDMVKPMLAKTYTAKKLDFTGDVYMQPKLDGIRCIAKRDGLYTRTNKKILSCPHIESALTYIFDEHPHLVLDGEIYNHDMKDDFNGIISLVRKTKNIDFDKTKVLQYHIYDIVDQDEGFTYRMEQLNRCLRGVRFYPSLRKVGTAMCNSEEELIEYNKSMLSLGYEGVMVRLDEPYKAGRQWRLMKYKQWQDAEFTILGFEEGKGEHEGLASKVIIDVDGVICKPTMTGTKASREQILEEQGEYIGGQVTVKYFEITSDGSLRFPTVLAVHKDGRDL